MLDRRTLLRGGLSLAGAATGWAAIAGRVVAGDIDPPPWIEGLAAARLQPWEGGTMREIEAVRAMNPEYDLMSRTFLAMALGDLALQDPSRWNDRAVAALDAMLTDIDARLYRYGQDAFLMGYGQGWRTPSLFVDGERLMILQIRRLLRDDHPKWATAARELEAAIAARMASTPTYSWPSYPDECWLFCNTLALSGLRAATVLDGTDHRALVDGFVASAAKRIDGATGLVHAGYTTKGRVVQGPEGSTIWACAHFLRLMAPEMAAAQYALARNALGRSVLGFGYAREWVDDRDAVPDVDSGPIVPLLGASPSSSGLAILGANSFGDARFARQLLASVSLAGIPRDDGRTVRFQAGNAVGDAVILAGVTVGPLWRALGAKGAV